MGKTLGKNQLYLGTNSHFGLHYVPFVMYIIQKVQRLHLSKGESKMKPRSMGEPHCAIQSEFLFLVLLKF